VWLISGAVPIKTWVAGTVAVELILCLAIGTVCMLIGFVVCLVDPASEQGPRIIAFGAMISLVFFIVGKWWAHASGGDTDQGSTGNPG